MTNFQAVAVPIASLRRNPMSDAALDTELLFGEQVVILQSVGEWHRIRNLADGYEGFLTNGDFGRPTSLTHVVATPGSFVYREADLKSPALMRLSFLSAVEVEEQQGDYLRTSIGYLHRATLKPADAQVAADPVTAARSFLNVPYKWGGRSSLGLDCSALVQLSHAACGVALPRDSGPQRDMVPESLALDAVAAGDLVFSPGHVMLATSRSTVIHASGFHMRVIEESLPTALERLTAQEREQVVAKRGPLRHDP